jgi:hypothetical protein
MQAIGYMVFALTPRERWSAARQLEAGSTSEQWFVLWAAAALVLLVILLIWVSCRRWAQSREQNRQRFAEGALQRGLGTRENQMLLAIAVRSGVRRAQDVFASPDVFDKGAGKLLAESSGTRTAAERDELKIELAVLRRKLGFPAAAESGTKHPSSRNIEVGQHVELIRGAEGIGVEAEVVRNDDIELVLEVHTPIQSQPGERWRVRHYFGVSVWEFSTSAVRCARNRLTLNHSDVVRRADRRRFPRVSVHVPALIAALPFLKDASTKEESSSVALEAARAGALAESAPKFREGLVTELAGPGLRIESRLPVVAGDRVLIIFSLAGSEAAVPARRRTVAVVGRVKRCQASEQGLSIAVELVGFDDVEIDEFVRTTEEIAAQAGLAKADDASAPVAAAT